MKNLVLTKSLIKVLEVVSKINKSTTLKNDYAFIEITGATMIVKSVYYQNQVVMSLPVENSQNGSFRIEGVEKLVKGLKKFNDNTSIEMNQYQVIITDDKKVIKLVAENDTYDTVPFTQNEPFIVSGVVLHDAYSKVKKTLAKENNRPILTGIHFKNNFIETVDGYRISQVDIVQNDFKYDVVVNAKGLEYIVSLAKKDKTDIIIDVDGKYMAMTISQNDYTMTVYAGLLEGEFIKSEPLFKNESEYLYTFEDSKEMQEELEYMKDMLKIDGDSRRNPVKFILNQNNFTLSDTENTMSTSVEFATVDCQNKDLQIGFNPSYMVDAIKNISGGFTMSFISPITPCIIRNESDTERYLVLPVRLS